ncbi:hypothetical protein [Nitrosopumilus sp.]|uniref:hypothetical protein n=1 Tax=Nitrosopumilus sp. TaxID=2024843 RepID=UPI00247B6019|nr:hypothetical protein [Nitrosopumilus sp.]MCV0409930.1 hypothetical protein [Nitrosopumilus sp.]
MVCFHINGFDTNADSQKFSEDPQRIQMIASDIMLQCDNKQNNILYVGSTKAANLYKNHLAEEIRESKLKITHSDKLEKHAHTAYVDRKMNVIKLQNSSKIMDYFGVLNQHCKSY